MNVLIYDAPVTLAHFVKSALLSQGHRAAISSDPEDAALKLSTSLFDAMVFGPGAAPRELADFVQGEFPNLPIVLAGVPVAIPACGQVAAVLPAPLSAHRLLMAFRRLRQERQERIERLPVQLAAEGLAIACRLADITPESMILAGESDAFHRHFETHPTHVQALVAGRSLGGEVAQIRRDLPRQMSRVDVRLSEGGAREVLAALVR